MTESLPRGQRPGNKELGKERWRDDGVGVEKLLALERGHNETFMRKATLEI
jgi:hypothetical protein